MPAVRIAHGIERGRSVTILVDGQPVAAHEGETLAAALAAAGRATLRHSPRAGTARGAFCLMGVCQECLVRVDGRLCQACRVVVAEGLAVECRGSL
ncbi:(2Fe-2S)-binding protein [Prosthecodimorpha staleyi]|uniref:(2Fe-2S)-binding protein n=1 Tax=Prosthecodimorpha staleyi TaxID=2840188 RepID=A0A947D8V8_9HYPH|nr:(2Fe-2S)-binding protein [Prosthecodimorpha staleyi]MBT9291656.1 (2Fe-2S)-binding protein [Prosthecodimorpha staleyi]